MFCPKCGAYLTEPDLVRRNEKFMGSTVIEYDARCPRCTDHIGHVSWGSFTPLEGLVPTVYQESDPEERLIPPPEQRPREPKAAAPAPEQAEAERICPHCGRPWPEE